MSQFLHAPLSQTEDGREHFSTQAAPPADPPIPIAPTAVLIADRAQRILHVDGGAVAAHGLRTEDCIGQTIEEVLPVHAAAAVLQRYPAALGGQPQSFEYRGQDGARGGHPHSLESRGREGPRLYFVQLVPVPDGQGAIGSVVAVMQDVTERARMTSDLARSEGRLREDERMVGVGSW